MTEAPRTDPAATDRVRGGRVDRRPRSAAAINVTALFGEAMTKSGVIWVEVPGDRAWPAWHAWVAPTAYVVNGPGEQHLPWLPEEVGLVLRSQDTGGRLLGCVPAPGSSPTASPSGRRRSTALQAGRLNAVDDVVERWRAECAVTALTPFGNPRRGPGLVCRRLRGRAPAALAGDDDAWRPWHLGGRPERRRGTR